MYVCAVSPTAYLLGNNIPFLDKRKRESERKGRFCYPCLAINCTLKLHSFSFILFFSDECSLWPEAPRLLTVVVLLVILPVLLNVMKMSSFVGNREEMGVREKNRVWASSTCEHRQENRHQHQCFGLMKKYV